MKDYFAKFARSDDLMTGFENLSLNKPSKPSKASFDGFDGALPKPSTVFGVTAKPIDRQCAAELIAKNQCPKGCGKMNLQDRKLDAWFCPTCRGWVVDGEAQ